MGRRDAGLCLQWPRSIVDDAISPPLPSLHDRLERASHSERLTHAPRKQMLSDLAVLVERTHNHVLGETIDRMYREFSFEARQERGRKIYFLCSTAYTVPTRKGVGREGMCNLLICGGPCRGRTYGPLIKSGRRPIIRTARCCEGFPVFSLRTRT